MLTPNELKVNFSMASKISNFKRQVENLSNRYNSISYKTLILMQEQLHQTITIEVPHPNFPDNPIKPITIKEDGLIRALGSIGVKASTENLSQLKEITANYSHYKQLPTSGHAAKHLALQSFLQIVTFHQAVVEEAEAFLNALSTDDELELGDEILTAIKDSIEGLQSFANSLTPLENAVLSFKSKLRPNQGGTPKQEEQIHFGNFVCQLASFYEKVTGKPITFGRDPINGNAVGDFHTFSKTVLLCVTPKPKHLIQYLETITSKILAAKNHAQK